MRNLLHAELIQLRTLRTTYFAVALALLLATAFTLGDFSEIGQHSLDTSGGIHSMLARDAGLVAAVVLALLGATRVGGEFRNHTIGQRALASPRRWRMVAAKLVTFGGLGAITGALTTAVAVPAAHAMAASKHAAFTLTTTQVAEIAEKAMVAGVLFAMLGVGIAFITRSQNAAIVIVLGLFLAEQILAGILGTPGDYLPYRLLDATFDLGNVSPAAGVLALAAITAALGAAGTVLLKRRDVR
jgi:ABC-type transport system involved in multi-copper enzyme maturation permease subunit